MRRNDSGGSSYNHSVVFRDRRTTDEPAAEVFDATGLVVALVRFRYTSAPMRNEWRFENPLGFQVLEYRRDQETLPSAATKEEARP